MLVMQNAATNSGKGLLFVALFKSLYGQDGSFKTPVNANSALGDFNGMLENACGFYVPELGAIAARDRRVSFETLKEYNDDDIDSIDFFSCRAAKTAWLSEHFGQSIPFSMWKRIIDIDVAPDFLNRFLPVDYCRERLNVAMLNRFLESVMFWLDGNSNAVKQWYCEHKRRVDKGKFMQGTAPQRGDGNTRVGNIRTCPDRLQF